MKRGKKRRGRAGSGSGLFGEKARLLAAALLLAALVNVGGTPSITGNLIGRCSIDKSVQLVINLFK